MSPSFPALPVELLELLASSLQPSDLCSVRLTCRELSRKILHRFSAANFTSVRTDLTPKSLQRLQSISETKHLAQYVGRLHIQHVDGYLGRGFQWHRHPSGHLVALNDGVNMLRNILVNNLVNCKSFHIDIYDEVRQYLSTDVLIPGDAVGIMLSIVADNEVVVRSFTIKSSSWTTRRLDTKRLPIPLCRQPQFRAAWGQRLEELVLENAMTRDQNDWALDLVSQAPRLRKLLLRFSSRYRDHSGLFQDRLFSAPSSHVLQDFSLDTATLTVAIISRFFICHRNTLRVLSFRYVMIDDDEKWTTVLQSMEGNLPHLKSLSVFWLREKRSDQHPRVNFPGLTGFPVVTHSETRANQVGLLESDSRRLESLEGPIRLTYKWTSGENIVCGASYSGPGMSTFLNVLAESAETT